jgi:hypothetical protein
MDDADRTEPVFPESSAEPGRKRSWRKKSGLIAVVAAIAISAVVGIVYLAAFRDQDEEPRFVSDRGFASASEIQQELQAGGFISSCERTTEDLLLCGSDPDSPPSITILYDVDSYDGKDAILGENWVITGVNAPEDSVLIERVAEHLGATER